VLGVSVEAEGRLDEYPNATGCHLRLLDTCHYGQSRVTVFSDKLQQERVEMRAEEIHRGYY
jgi:hypothetical protein